MNSSVLGVFSSWNWKSLRRQETVNRIVWKHDDKLVFRNPGLLRIPIEQVYEGSVSYARNPKIQNMLRMVGYGENLGSGFPMILDAWKQSRWGEPVLKNKIELDEFELDLPVQAQTEEMENHPETVEKTREKTREKIISLSERTQPLRHLYLQKAYLSPSKW